MPELELPLERLQAWMQAVIVHPAETAEAVAAEETRALLPAEALEQVLLPSRTLGALERLDIYHGMYPLRMVEALRGDYEALAHFLGAGAFARLVQAYVQVHPSRSFTLNRLGDQLPEFVNELPGLQRRGFCHDLALLERAIATVFDAPETQALSAEAIAAVPAEAWERARFETVAAFRLLALRHNANDYLQTVLDENHDHPKPRARSAWIALYRRDYTVYRLELARPAHDLLRDLAAGLPLGEAVGAALRRGRPAPREDQLFRWFREWMAGGVFRSVVLD